MSIRQGKPGGFAGLFIIKVRDDEVHQPKFSLAFVHIRTIPRKLGLVTSHGNQIVDSTNNNIKA